MPEEKTQLTINQEDDGRISIQGNEEDVKKASMLIAELFLKEDEITEAQLETIIDIAQNLYDDVKGSPEHLKAAKKFLEAVENFRQRCSDQRRNFGLPLFEIFQHL